MASNKIQNLTADTFEAATNNNGTLTLVDFWAPWCGPCKAIAPILEEIAEESADKVAICKVDVDDNRDIATKFNIRSIPTIILFKNGKVADQIVGMTSKADLLAKIDMYK